MTALDSAHQICLSMCTEDVLIVVGGSSSLDLKKLRNWSRFNLYLHDQGWYGKTDDSIGFSASSMYIYMQGRRSNCSWGLFIAGFKKKGKFVIIQFIS